MDGLMLYRQYLENIREEVLNYNLDVLNSKSFIDILYRQREINDLSNIEYILQKAGVKGSFLGNKKFLNKKVILKSKLSASFIDEDLDLDLKEAVSECLLDYIEDEDAILSKIDKILNTKGIKEIDLCPCSSSGIMSCNELIESNKSTLEALFGVLASEEDIEDIENTSYMSDFDMDEFGDEDVSESDKIEGTVDTEGSVDTGDTVDTEGSVDIVAKSTKFDDEINVTNIKENISNELENKDVEDTDLLFGDNKFLDDNEFEDEDSLEDTDIENRYIDGEDSEDRNLESSCLEDNCLTDDLGYLDTECKDDDDDDDDVCKSSKYTKYTELEEMSENTDLENQSFYRDATRQFLEKKGNEDLKKLYKQKEKLSESVSDVDDALAKTLLALGDGVLSLPTLISHLLEKGKKIKNNMIVDDEEEN